MKPSLRLLFLGLLLLAGISAGATPPTIPGRLVFKLQPGRQVSAVERALLVLDATNVVQKFPRAVPPSAEKPGSVDLRGIYQIQTAATLPLDRARTVLLATGAVEYVEPLYTRQPMYQPNDPLADSTLTSLSASQYYLKQIKAYRGWDVTRGDSSIVIGITDGGLRLTHQDLRRQLKHNYADPINGVDDDNDGYVDNFTGWDLANNDNDSGYDITLIHGTLVAGVAGAQADNGSGIAGVGNKCRIMPLNIYPNTPTGNFAGVEAVVYAADHGCQVINMSWGAAGGYSRYEQDAMTYAAVNRDAVLVAAAGNTSADLLFYPASYDHVLSVSGVNSTDQKSPNATFSRRVDLTAPGISVLTTYGYHGATSSGPADGDYIAVSGTSFSSPMVAGAAALVRRQFPQYNAAQIRAQLRQTADNTDGLAANAAWVGRMGSGRLNVRRALTQTAAKEARVVSTTFAPVRSTYLPGDTIRLTTTVQNLLQPVTGLTVTLTSLSPYITVRQGTYTVGSLTTLARADNAAAPFRVAVASSGIPLNATGTLRYRITAAGGFQLDQFVEVLLNPDYVVVNANDMALTLTSRGNLAFDNLDNSVGLGLTYRNSGNLLSEGGLIVATTPSRVSDRLRTLGGMSRESFYNSAQATRQMPGPRADQEARAVFQDTIPSASRPVRSVGVRVRQHAYAWATPAARRDFVVLEYTLRNLTADTLKPLYAGLFMDWDLPSIDGAGRNAALWDSTRNLGYCYALGQATPSALPAQYGGVRMLRGGTPAVYSIDNAAPVGAPVRLADGFTAAEKFRTLSNGTARAQRTVSPPNGTDVSQVVGCRVAKLAPGDSVTVAFAVIAAPNLAQLQTAADAAGVGYTNLLPAKEAAPAARLQLYPNPTSGPLRVEMPTGFGPAETQVLNSMGQLLVRSTTTTEQATFDLSGLAPGLYTVRVVGEKNTLTRAVVVQ